MVVLTSLVFPLIKLSLLFVISLALKLHFFPGGLAQFMRCYHHLDEWGMLEVYMVGILVTIVMMNHIAQIQYDAGLLCFIGLLWAALASSVVLVNIFSGVSSNKKRPDAYHRQDLKRRRPWQR